MFVHSQKLKTESLPGIIHYLLPNTRGSLSLLVSLFLLFSGCKSESTPHVSQPETTSSSQTERQRRTPPVAEPETPTVEVTIVATDYMYAPNRIEVPVNNTLRITFRNEGRQNHNLVIPSWDLRTRDLRPGQRGVLEYTPETAGDVPFNCPIEGHIEHGMIGTIVVTEAPEDMEEEAPTEAVEEGITGEEESETPPIDENP